MITITLSLHRCQQCYRYRAAGSFVRVPGTGTRLKNCSTCRGRLARWPRLSLVEKLAESDPRQDPPATSRVIWSRRSGNAKLGPIPSSLSERGTCPRSCGLYEAGCYAGYGLLGHHWTAAADRGLPWAEFLARVRALPPGTLWRHNEAGDLQGDGERLDAEALEELIAANLGRAGFTFTHYTARESWPAIACANAHGFTVNLSADTLAEADALAAAGVGPVAALVGVDHPQRSRTPAGRVVVVCPAQTHGLTCAVCRLCARPQRRSIVAFRAHGQYRAHVTELVQLRRGATA